MKLLTDGQGKAVRRSVGKNSGQRPSKALEQLIRTMKLTCVLLTVAFLHVSAGGFSQQVTLSMKDAPIEKVFREIERQTGYGFLYNKKMFADFPNVTIEVKNANIKDVLDRCFNASAIEYVMNDQTIVIREKVQPEKGTGSPAAPPGTVHGRVLDAQGNPIAGASVTLSGTKRGTTTDKDGEFTLKDVPDGEYEVVISYVGFENYRTKVSVANHEAWLSADLKQSMSKLDETVVKGYYSTTNRLNTGDVTTVKGEDIQKQPVSDPILALEGRVPGLYIQQTSGAPGSYSTIQIRGQNSIANGNDPLYIVDNVPFSSASLSNSSALVESALGVPNSTGVANMMGSSGGSGMSPFNSLNPADIESIEVLKDADATAIYGSRGANGVIIITTKKGKAGATRFDLNAYSGASQVTRMMHLLNTKQYLMMRREAFTNDGLSIPSIVSTPKDNNYDIDGVWDTTRYTNWQKVLIGNTANFTNIQGDLSGGNANTQFLIGAGYNNQGTVYPGSFEDQKASVHFSLTHASADQRLHVQLSANYVYDNSNLPQIDLTSSLNLAPDAPAIYNSDGSINWQVFDGTSTWNNPLSSTLQTAKATTNNLISNLVLGYTFFKGLELKSSFGYNHDLMNQISITPGTAYGPPNQNLASNRLNGMASNDAQGWIIEPQLDFQKAISKGTLNMIVGSTFEQNLRNSLSQYAYGFPSDAQISDPLAASTIALYGETNILYHYSAIFGRIGYDWQQKYLLNITARRDGSSRFGPGKQFGDFGAIGAGWIFSKERFAQDHLGFLSFGKIRMSYGTAGNDQITDYQFLSTYTPLSTAYQGVTGLSPTQLTNPYFSWEVVKKLEGGLEMGFLRDRILFSFSYYRDRTNNQLVNYPLPRITGFGSVEYNLPAIVQNTGEEFVLNTANIQGAKFTWRTSLNFSLPTNKLVAYPNIMASSYAHTYTVGQPLSTKLMTHYTGLNSQTGVYTYSTKNTNGIPSYPQDLVSHVPVTQKFYGGIENDLHYQGFELDFLIQFTKQTALNYLAYFLSAPGSYGYNQPTVVLGRWQHPGDNAHIQKFTSGANTTVTNTYNALRAPAYDDHIVSDASFIRLKNVSFSYRLPKKWQAPLHLENTRIYLQAQNLFTVTKYLGLDPETGGLNLPPLRTITGGIQIGF